MEIKLKEDIGTRCIALDDGIRLYEKILPELKAKQPVYMDFTGVEAVFSPFLMGCVGRLLDHFEKEFLMEHLMLRNIQPEHLKTVNEFIDRAEQRLTEKTDLESMKEFFEEDELGDI
ncbi:MULTISPECIES: STAS-like domain-containing protein [unclassified Nitrospina]|uniref:STAS-like domain-containing protein n=1 Tax=unclassified Nitrospina TaxID=2638683 RepID=UPI003F993F2E